jgi:hypoxanthine phosphoribosyltransferase
MQLFGFALAGIGYNRPMASFMHDDLDEILLTEEQIHKRLDALAAEIARAYEGKDLTMVSVLTGGVLFMADLLRRLPMKMRLDFIGVSSYRGETRSTGELVVTKALKLDVRDRDILIVDDILDTGLTLVKVREMMLSCQPRDLKFCVFLEKDVPHKDNFKADFVGFHIPNKFVVGYGLDFRERYRNLPFVATLKPEVIAEKS